VHGALELGVPGAQDAINTGHKFVLRVWGDDPFSDDLVYGPYVVTPVSAGFKPGFIGFDRSVRLRRSRLNEDPAPFDNDEIYVGVRFVNSGGATLRAVETNRVVWQFG
jgi:hypothetical protein